MNNLDLIFSQDSLLMVIKIGYLAAYLLYLMFAVVVVAQVKQMTKTIDAGMNGSLVNASYIHLLMAALLFVIALVVL